MKGVEEQMDPSTEKTEDTRKTDLILARVESGTTSVQETMELLSAELLETVSHELRSPLTIIKGYIATLLMHEERVSLEERHEFLLTMKEACERLEQIIARMFELAQLETGQVTLQLSPVNLTHLIRETIIAVEQHPDWQQRTGKATHSRDHSAFTLRLGGTAYGLPVPGEPVIQADRRLLEKMLFHLFENALRYAPEDTSVNILVQPVADQAQTRNPHVGAEETTNHQAVKILPITAHSQPMIEICIQDQGNGIEPKHLEHIFERFQRADMQLTRDGGGLGLGLAICRYIVALHHGNIWAESEVGKGSMFHVQLPIDPALQ